MAVVTLPYTLTNGQNADASQVMADLNALVTQVNGNLDLTNLAASLQQLLTPAGTVIESAAPTAPTGYLACDGSAVSRTTYAALYAALGGAASPWGQGNGSTTFNLPDLRGRVAVGAGAGTGLTSRALAASGGEERHTLTDAELPARRWVTTSPGATQRDDGPGGLINPQSYVDTGGGSHENMQPWVALNRYVKT